ncbi:hypothetical protein ASJ30_14455 [Janibacter indicus]|uniref:TniQ domain-containing protein n=2 Tax=Janibacter indicus TaxID=857417 RepID=A0A1L3MJP4_9MICO|nr:hypothetical protein ASJ30_14455 [Janibacter indicus]
MPSSQSVEADLVDLLARSLPGQAKGTNSPSLRSIPGDFDIDGPPLATRIMVGESFAGWISRVAVRYDTPPRALLNDALGQTKMVTSTRAMIKLLSADPAAAARLGVPVGDLARWATPTALEVAAIAYGRTYRAPTAWQRAAHRFCPECLRRDQPYWRRAWAHPLTWVCTEHHVRLTARCPRCEREPFGTGTWVTRPVTVTECTHRQPTTARRSYRKIRRPCGADLRDADATVVSEVEVRAQEALHAFAEHHRDRFTMLGVTVTGAIAFDAFVELIADQARAPATTGALATRHVEAAAAVVSAASLEHAAALLDEHDLLAPHGVHAPVGPALRISARPHNPLLAAMQLTRHAGHLSPSAQLTYRTASGRPRYPDTDHSFRRPNAATPTLRVPRKQRSDLHLRLPEAGVRRPEPDPCWFPQVLWPGALPSLEAINPSGTGAPVTRAAGALLAAKVASLTSWGDLALELALPRHATHSAVGLTRALRRRGLWATILAEVDALVTRLQKTPPPIDYRVRRVVGDDVALLAKALDCAGRDRPPYASRPDLLRRFWELFTGGDVAFGPQAIALKDNNADYANFAKSRGQIYKDHAQLFATAHGYLARLRGVAVGGPLYWIPP